MSWDQFTTCYADSVETTVDSVIDDLNQLGRDGVNTVVNWWSNLDDKTRALVTTVGGLTGAIAGAVLTKILNSALGQFIGVCLIGLLGGAAWALLIKSLVNCAPLVDA